MILLNILLFVNIRMFLFAKSTSAWAAIALALGAFMMVSLMLYITVDSNARRRQPSYQGLAPGGDSEITKLKEQIQSLRSKAQDNTDMLNRLHGKMVEAIDQSMGSDVRQQMDDKAFEIQHEDDIKDKKKEQQEGMEENGKQIPKPQNTHSFMESCPSDSLLLAHNASSDVQMLNVYDVIPFDNTDGGVWKQGWPVEYDKNKIKMEKRLEVIIVPHSHNDPGWLKTFEGYFEDQTRHILDNMVTHLSEKPEMKFIYAEMSFFELWWSQQNLETKAQVKKLIERKQLEIVTGGWVMTDEANAHYYSTVMELFEGHEFLRNQLDYSPVNHWSIDPFGLSPTLAYILNRANLSHMVIQRVHYAVKKHLARSKQLEFLWRQLFAGHSQKTDIITHMFPFYSYDAPHSCGPDPKVCCQFDFRRLGGQMSCPWRKNAVPITDENIAERSELLSDQYRKKAQLYGYNTILVPLGDDFRYDLNSEWTDQYENYKKLFKYMNAKEEWNIHARFGTLADYFLALEQRLNEVKIEHQELKEKAKLRHSIISRHLTSSLPILSGDFFTYADRDDHYWSGYFTSRPFYKHMDRTLQHFLRTADIFFTLANWNGKMPSDLESMYNSLVGARRAMSLFQHHDGVTGTAKTFVMTDYGEKMSQAISDSKRIIAKSAQFLMNMADIIQDEPGLHVDEEHFVSRLPDKIITQAGSIVIVANPLGQPRKEVVCLHVNNIKSRISKKLEAEEIQQQIGPILHLDLEGNLAHYSNKFELCFLAQLPSFGLVRYEVIETEDVSHKIKIYSNDGKFHSDVFNSHLIAANGEKIVMKNEHLNAFFDPMTGYLKSIITGTADHLDINLSFVHYGTRPRNTARRDGGDSLSGAYLFLPDGPAVELETNQNSFLFIKGPIRQYIHIKGPLNAGIRHQISLDINSPFLSILNNVNLAMGNGIDRGNRATNEHLSNYELAMRLQVPSIKMDNFFTDLNGFQMIRRRRQSKLPLQAHFYPMPGSAFIEDSQIRVSLLGRQALGVGSLESGEMQVMLDRRLVQDDDRGLGQGVEDNLLTENSFRLYVEYFTHGEQQQITNGTVGFHSLAAHHFSLQLHYPPVLLIGQLDHATSTDIPTSFSGLKHPFPCDIHPVAFRTLSQPTIYADTKILTSPDLSAPVASTAPRREAALVLHRFGMECTIMHSTRSSLNSVCLSNSHFGEKLNIDGLFPKMATSIKGGSLTLLHVEPDGKNVTEFTLELAPMELATVKIEF